MKMQLNPDEIGLLHELRAKKPSRKHLKPHTEDVSFGSHMADVVAAMIGSWTFLIVQSCILVAWIILNVVAWVNHWDPFPFILLNLVLSFQAAFTAPIIMISQNRQAEIDRLKAKQDYDVNLKAELEIELLHQKIDMMREQEIARLTEMVEKLQAQKSV